MRALLPILLVCTLQAQAPAFLDQLPPAAQVEAMDIVNRADFVFETRTEPKHVRMSTMEKLFDHPVLGAAMWRNCQFVPGFYAFIHPDGAWSIDDTRGLHGTLRLVYKRPGHRVYLVEGRAEKGRLKTPFAVGAKMLTSYRYWEGKNGFESHLQTWTALDSAVLGALSRPFRGYIKGRQDEFIAYINGNVATFGEFAELSPRDFYGPLKRDGDPMALREFEALFLGK
ncbi:hypothetical protein GETHLI_15690 [Geothrix limicola]|uniref:Uncharacterized protein n=1 Tax=Geothrix limicola TaxID=2927978 RepID=A0ABQ5QEJ8_9BACT|nr:hypothetical protein [Geothrix limicola]GLH73067.1 hypothetical protein GETHLI_15690 [Geothrix limicola]